MIEKEEKIIAYVNGDLNKEESTKLLKEIEGSVELKKLLQIHNKLEEKFNTHLEIPNSDVTKKFNNFLTNYKSENIDINKPIKVLNILSIMKYAALFIVLIAASVTIWKEVGQNESQEELALREILSEMKTKTDTEKIKAIYVNNISDNTSQIKQVLIQSLKTDKSSNVRLASVETLMDYISDDMVRSALIRSLGIEEDPQVQVAIIMALSQSKNKEAIKPLEEIINKEGGYKFVKDEAHVGILNLTSI